MQQLAQSLPAFDLLKAYREGAAHFNTRDIVVVVNNKDQEGFIATPRSAYIEQAFRRFTPEQRKMHPLVNESAHTKMKMPNEAPAFWLVVELQDQGAAAFCAIGAVLQSQMAAG